MRSTLYWSASRALSTSNDEYGYVINNPSTTKIDGDTYFTFTVWNGTEEVEINVDNKKDVDKGDFVKYAIDANNIADSQRRRGSADRQYWCCVQLRREASAADPGC